jgi:hypothetical protein
MKKQAMIRPQGTADGSETTPANGDGRQLPADAVRLLAEMAARGRARLREMGAEGTPPWTAAKQDPAWQQEWKDLIAQIRDDLPEGITPEEIEAEVSRVTDEVRKERLARGR